jgi:hypothetical protein
MANPTKNVEAQMQLALDVCHAADKLNFSVIARQFPLVNRTTLQRRFHGEQESRAKSNSTYRQNLTAGREEQLI